MLKAAIVLTLIATVVSLFSGLFFLVKDDSSSNRLVIALSVRVALAAITVGLIAWGFFSGQLVSHHPGNRRSEHARENSESIAGFRITRVIASDHRDPC